MIVITIRLFGCFQSQFGPFCGPEYSAERVVALPGFDRVRSFRGDTEIRQQDGLDLAGPTGSHTAIIP